MADANLDWSPGIAGALLGALLGALIGGLLTGAVQWRLERRREEAQAKDGARPLRVELSLAKGRVESAIEELLWWPFYEMAFEPWDRYRDVLAVDLDPEGWDSVTQSVAELRALSEGMEKAPGDPSKPRPLGPKTGQALVPMREHHPGVQRAPATGRRRRGDGAERSPKGGRKVRGVDLITVPLRPPITSGVSAFEG